MAREEGGEELIPFAGGHYIPPSRLKQVEAPNSHIIKSMSDDDSGADPAPCRGSHQPGHPNYQNNILISIVERLLPNGNEGWRLVALAYQQESGEENLHYEDDLKKNWFCKLCNNMK